MAVDIQEVGQENEKSFEDKLAHARARDIVSVATSLGISVEKVGTTLRNAEHPSQVFYPSNNRFMWFSQDISGDAITLVQTMTEQTFKQAVDYLNTENLLESEVPIRDEPKKSFHYYVQETNDSFLARQYLVNERHINPEIVERLFNEGYLVQATYMPNYPETRVLAPCLVAKWERHGELVGGTIQGLLHDEEQFGKRGRDKRIMGRSESNFGWNYTLGHPNKIVFAESVIDLLSYWSLHPKLDNCYLCDLEGLKENSLKEFMKELIIEKKGSIDQGVILAVDNDVAGQIFIDKLSKYQFFEHPNFQLAQPMNNVVLSEHYAIYQEVGKQFQVDPLAIAAVHKGFTNGSNTNQLANLWKNDQFFGKYLKPTEKPEEIDVRSKCEKVAIALQEVKINTEEYDFILLTTSVEKTFERLSMGQKLLRFYQMYQTEGIQVVNEIVKDQNDLLRSTRQNQVEGEKRMAMSEEQFPEKIQQALELIQTEQNQFEQELRQQTKEINVYEFGQRQLIFSEFRQALQEIDPTNPTEMQVSFVTQLNEMDNPLERTFRMVHHEPEMLENIWEDHMLVTHFVVAAEEPEEVIFDSLSRPMQTEIALSLEALKQSFYSIDGENIDPAQSYSLNLHLQNLRGILQTEGLISENQLTERVNGFPDHDWLKQITQELLTLSDETILETTRQIVAIDEHIQDEASKNDKMNDQILNDFKKWAKDYDGVGKEYIPLEEIASLQVSPENKLVLDTTWFDSLEEYLETHKDDLFGSSVSYKNALLFVDLIADDYRELVVVEQQIRDYQKLFFEEREDIPQETKDVFDHFTVYYANPTSDEKVLPILGGRQSEAMNENAQTIILVEEENGNELVFEYVSEFVRYVETVDREVIREIEFSEKLGELNQDLDTIKEWMNQYEGRDSEYIPKEEIERLAVEITGVNEALLVDELEGKYVRLYSTIQEYLDSFEGNMWQETASYQSLINYFSHRNNPAYQRFELMKEKLIAVKEKITLENHPSSVVWENIHCLSEEQLQNNTQQKLLFYQDPTRKGNPIFFDSFDEAQLFVSDMIRENQLEQSDKKPFGAFFRRERKDREKDVSSKNNSQILEENFLGIHHPMVHFGIEKEKNTLPVRPATPEAIRSKDIGKTTEELIEAAKEGVKDFIDSDTYKNYLQVMSKFPTYSWRNNLLIYMQKPDVSLVAGFSDWKKKFDRHVVRNAKGIKILAPIIKNVEVEKIVKGRKELVKEQRVVSFRPVTVFDVSQTEGKELPTLTKELTGDIRAYSQLFEAIAATTDFSISFDEIESGAKGICDLKAKRIVLQTGMSEVHTIKTLVHEVTHSLMHSDLANRTSRQAEEIEAESTAYVVCTYLGLDTSDFSFGYLASWSQGKKFEEMTSSFAKIQKQAKSLIQDISTNLEELTKEFHPEKGVSQKIEHARANSKVHNQIVKKSPAKTQQQEIKPPKER